MKHQNEKKKQLLNNNYQNLKDSKVIVSDTELIIILCVQAILFKIKTEYRILYICL